MGILGNAVANVVERRAVTGSALEKYLINGSTGSNGGAGMQVDQDTALSSSAIFQGLRILSGSVAMVPLGIFQPRSGGGREPLRSHPVHRVFRRPNAELTGIELRQMITSFAVSAGNGYAEIVFDGGGQVSELWPIPPHRIKPDRSPSGTLRYIVSPPGGQPYPLPMERVFHLRGFMRGGLLGVDAIAKMQTAVGLTLATDQFAGSFFANGSVLSGFLKHPAKLTEEGRKNVIEAFEGRHRGPNKAHRIALLEEGLDWVQAGADPEKSQLIEQRNFNIEEASRILNVPPHLLHHLARATFNNIEHLGISFVVYSLGEWFKRWEETIALRLLLPSEADAGLYAKHNATALLRGDHTARANFYNTLAGLGALSPDDIRELEDLNPLPDGIGARYFVRRDTWPLDEVDALVSAQGEPSPSRSARAAAVEQRAARIARSVSSRRQLRRDFEGLFLDAATAAVRKEAVAIRGALKKAYGGRDAARLYEEVDRFYADFDEWLAERFTPTLKTYGRRVASEAAREVDADDVPEIDEFVAAYAATLGKRWTGSSAGQLRALIRDSDPAELEEILEERLVEWEEKRPGKVASRETVEAGDAITNVVWAAAGVTAMVWSASGENCPLCDELNGRTVGITGSFLKEGETLSPDGTAPLTTRINISHPPLHEGCDCVIVPGI